MLRFADKLDYLMTLFKVSNSELAKGINVDPSLISRWKTGERALARNSNHLPNIARFFIGFESYDYQRDILKRIISDHYPEFSFCDANQKIFLFTSWLQNAAPSSNLGTGKTIINQSPLGMAVCRNGSILFVNQAFNRIFECPSHNSPVGRAVLDFIEPESRAAVAFRFKPDEAGIIPPFAFDTVGWRCGQTGFPMTGEVSVVDLQDGPANVLYINDSTDLKDYEEKLKRQLDIQDMILSISTIFNHVALERIDDLINETLARIGRFDSGDRCYVFQYSDDGKTMSNTHEWSAQGIMPEMDNLRHVLADSLPWWHQNMLKRDYLYIPDIGNLPRDAAREKEMLTGQQIQSLLVVPLRADGRLIGFVGIDSVHGQKIWGLDFILMLQTIAQIVCRGIIQKRHLQAMADSENFYRVLFNAGEIKMILDPQFKVVDVNDGFAAMTGYDRQAIKGRYWPDLITAESRRDFTHGVNSLSEIRRATIKLKIPTRQRSVTVLNILASIENIPGLDRYIVTFIDLSEQSRVRRALKSIHDCNNDILKSSTEEGMLEQFCRNVVEKGGHELAWVGHVIPGRERSIRPAAIAGRDDGYVNSLDIRLDGPIAGNGPAALAVRENHVKVCKSNLPGMECSEWVKENKSRAFRALICIPMAISADQPNAVLSIYSNNEDAFDDVEVRLLTNMATSLTLGAAAIRNLQKRSPK